MPEWLGTLVMGLLISACLFAYGAHVLTRPDAGKRPDVRPRRLRVKMCVWLGVSRGLDLAFLNAD